MMMFSQVMVIVVSMTVMVMMSVRVPVMMVVAVPMIMRAIIGLERRCHLDAGKSMLREERLDLGPLLQPDAVG
jgi:uncharacterized membrane protein